MKKNQLFIYIFLSILVFGGAFFVFHKLSFAATDATVGATVKISVCGNGVKEGSEQCDGSDLAGQSCTTKGYTGGSLSCNSDCTFNTSQCTSAPSGGGGGGGYYAPPETKIVFSGRAYPKSTVTFLKDAQIAGTAIAGADANFQASLAGLSGGNYIFGVYSEDGNGRRSSALTFPLSVASGAIARIDGLFIAPIIAVDKSEVKRGENIAIFGQSAPNAEIIIAVGSGEELSVKTVADKNGRYLHNFDTASLGTGQYQIRAKAALEGNLSPFSEAMSLAVAATTVAVRPVKDISKKDLNGDGRVNLVEFSIMAYWYKKSSAPPAVDFNGDGVVDLIDLSILAFYWTG